MKKRFKLKRLINRLSLLLIIPLIFMQCQKHNDNNEIFDLTPKFIGEIHNKSMTNFKNNYIAKFELTTEKQHEDIIRFNFNYINIELDMVDQELDIKSLDNYLNLFNTNELINNNLYLKKDNKDVLLLTNDFNGFNALDKVEFLSSIDILQDSEKEYLDKLIKYHKQNYELKLSNAELYNRVLEIRTSFYLNNYDNERIGFIFTASLIELAFNSIDWWDKNLTNQLKTNYYKEEKIQIAPWIIADFIGAFGAAFMNIIEQGYKDHKKPIDAEELMYAMLKSGVVSSVAPWSRIAKLFSKP